MQNIWNKLDGFKTYLAAAFMLVQGIYVDGYQNKDWNQAVVKIQAALVVFGFRHAIK